MLAHPNFLRILSASALLALVGRSMAQTNEGPASMYRWMLDPEFVQADMVNDPQGKHSSLGTYLDVSTGNVWVFGVDPATGQFLPFDGKGTLVQAAADPVGSLGAFTLNGPEWACGSEGCSSVYTAFGTGQPASPTTAYIGIAAEKANYTWKTSRISQPRNGPMGGQSSTQCARISYQDVQGYHYWRCLNDPTSEEMFPGLGASGLLPAIRFVDGPENAAVYPVPVNGFQQIFEYNLTSKAFTQLTFDATNKEQPWMWHAPEYGNALVMLSTTNKTELSLFESRSVMGASKKTVYSKVVSLQAPEGYTIFSTEPFTYKGNSYALMQMMTVDTQIPIGIWLADLNAQHPSLVRVTAPAGAHEAEADPEFFITNNGPIAYYSRFDTTKCVGTTSPWFCIQGLEGLFRVDLNLPVANAVAAGR